MPRGGNSLPGGIGVGRKVGGGVSRKHGKPIDVCRGGRG